MNKRGREANNNFTALVIYLLFVCLFVCLFDWEVFFVCLFVYSFVCLLFICLFVAVVVVVVVVCCCCCLLLLLQSFLLSVAHSHPPTHCSNSDSFTFLPEIYCAPRGELVNSSVSIQESERRNTQMFKVVCEVIFILFFLLSSFRFPLACFNEYTHKTDSSFFFSFCFSMTERQSPMWPS